MCLSPGPMGGRSGQYLWLAFPVNNRPVNVTGKFRLTGKKSSLLELSDQLSDQSESAPAHNFPISFNLKILQPIRSLQYVMTGILCLFLVYRVLGQSDASPVIFVHFEKGLLRFIWKRQHISVFRYTNREDKITRTKIPKDEITGFLAMIYMYLCL